MVLKNITRPSYVYTRESDYSVARGLSKYPSCHYTNMALNFF